MNNVGPLIIVCILLLFLAIWLCPLLCIWCVNTLFNMGIEYTLLNWLAALVLLFLFGRGGTSKSD